MRIIGGVWRSRVIDFPDLPGLRPTPDRVRETLFNWLGQRLDGRRCLDLFAGSGALGFEAASRGAAEVVMVERDARAIASLRAQAVKLGAAQVRIVAADGLDFLAGECGRFDLILLDPPFDSGQLAPALARAATRLAAGGRIYAEFGKRPDLTGWRVLREGRAGSSHFCLLEPQ
ncbi:MAG: 16S rRNA (guanine(966)-N(2))-methyltransferase RsmD [Thiobacillaceae bacterium]